MAQVSDRPAEMVAWEAPGGIPMSIVVVKEEGSSLEVSIDESAVVIRGRHCRHVTGDPDDPGKTSGTRMLAEVHLTVALERCQIVWKMVEGK